MASIGYSHIWSTDTTCNIAYVAKTHVLGTWKDGTNLSQNVTSLLQTSNYTPVVVVGESNTNNVRITGNLVVSGSITTSGAIAGGATGGSATIDASNVVSGNLNTARMPSTLQLDTISPTIYINSSGNVGIGTTGSSLARLTVSGNFISTGTVTASNYVGTISASSISAGALDKARLPSAISVNTDTQSFFISSSGFIGLGGITVPGEPLDVSGTVKATTFSGSGASLTSLNIGIGAVSPKAFLTSVQPHQYCRCQLWT